MFAVSPLVCLFVRQRRPEYYGLLPDGAKVEPGSEADIDGMIDRGVEYASGLQEVEFTLRQALRTPTYWMLITVRACQMVVFGGFTIHCIPFLTDIGIDPTVAGGMMGIMVFFTMPSRFFSGFIADRISKDRLRFLLAGALLSQAIGIGAFLLNQTLAMVYVLLILYGFGSGATAPLNILIRGRYFGRKAYGSISGAGMVLVAPLALAAPVYAGWVYDTTGSYMTAFSLFAALATVAAILISFVAPPKPPAQITEIHKFM